jgi:hypothetical protein
MGSQFRSFSLNTFSCTRPVIMADTIWEGKVRLHRYIWEDQQSSDLELSRMSACKTCLAIVLLHWVREL